MTNMNEFINELEDKKALIELFKSNRKGNNKIDGNKLSTLAVKLASRLDTDNKNIKLLGALILLAIASSLDTASASQKVITKALGLLS